MKSALTLLAAAAAFSLAGPAAAQESDGYGMGPNYYFYGPTTNYFGQSAPAYAPQTYGPMPAYYGGYYGGDTDWNNPPQYYDAIRQDPWHGYNDDWDNGY